MPITGLHSGVITFRAGASFDQIKAAGKTWAKAVPFHSVIIRRCKDRLWGLQFVVRCNKACRGKDISKEVRFWIRLLNKKVSNHDIDQIDVSGVVYEVIVPNRLTGP